MRGQRGREESGESKWLRKADGLLLDSVMSCVL